MFSRRSFIARAGGCALYGTLRGAVAPPSLDVPLELEALAFDFDQLEPVFDAESLRIHHDVIHADCLAQLSEALHRLHLQVANVTTLMSSLHSLMELPDHRASTLNLRHPLGPAPDNVVQMIRRFGGAHINHTLFWRSLSPPGRRASTPEGDLKRLVRRDFGNVANLKKAFTRAAMQRFGSGWAWLCYRNDGSLFVCSTANEDNPLMVDHVPWYEHGLPLLGLDLWEHAYCRRYHEDRRRYVEAWWKVVHWPAVERAYAKAIGR